MQVGKEFPWRVGGYPRQVRLGRSCAAFSCRSLRRQSAKVNTINISTSTHEVTDVPAAQISDGLSAVDMRQLEKAADLTGTPLEELIRSAWDDNFSLLISELRETDPDSFSDAEIVDAEHAWIAFAGPAPDKLQELLESFSQAAPHVEIEIRTDQSYSESQLQASIESVHYATLGSPAVRDATTSFDTRSRTITTMVLLADSPSATTLNELNKAAQDRVTAVLEDSGITALVIEADTSVLGGGDSASYYYGGETITGCTTGFGTRATSHTSGTRGISTAGHCNNSQTDDGHKLKFKDAHNASQGDFQWHTGPVTESDDFYEGTATVTETIRTDVAGVGAPTVGQFLCQNGATNHFNCQDVRKLNVCSGNTCNLVMMGSRLAAGGDSGGPVFRGNTSYGLHKGWMYDPVAPFDRDLFSRSDRMDNALGIWVATN